MGERQNFYSLQLPEQEHIPSPRDSGLTGLFIISLAFSVFGLCRVVFIFFSPEWKSLRWKRNAEKGGKKSTGFAACSCCRRKAGQAEVLFFLLLFSLSLNPSSLLPWRRVTARNWVLFLGDWLLPPPPPHPSTVPPYGQAAEQRLGREGKQKEANKPTTPRRPRKAPEQPSAAKTCREISLPPRLPPSPSRSWSECPDFHQDLFFLSPSSFPF